MHQQDYLNFLTFMYSIFPITVVDIIIIVLLLLYLYSESVLEEIESLSNALKLLASLLISLVFYSLLANSLLRYLSIWRGFIDAISLLCLFLSTYILFVIVGKVISSKTGVGFHYSKKYLKAIFGTISFAVILMLASSLILALGTSKILKDTLVDSIFVRTFLVWQHRIETNAKGLFFLESSKTINATSLDRSSPSYPFFTSFKSVEKDENAILYLYEKINLARAKNGLSKVVANDALSKIALDQASYLAEKGELSRFGQREFTIYDRLFENGQMYSQAFEIPIFAVSKELLFESVINYTFSRKQLLDYTNKEVGIAAATIDGKGILAVIILVR